MSTSTQPGRFLPLPDTSRDVARQLQEAAALIQEHQSFVVTAHSSPDGDAVGSTLALTQLLRELGKTATAFNRNEIPYNLRFLVGADEVVNDVGALDLDLDVLVVLDCSSLERVHPDLKLDRSRTRIICIDHHETIDEPFADVFVHDVRASAVGEILYRLVETLSCEVSPAVAQCLFTSIQTDTGSFRYSNTTPAALIAAGQLVSAGVNVWQVSSEIYEKHPAGRVQLLGEVLSTLQRSSCGRLAFLTVTRDMYERTGTGPDMLDGFINFARGIDGVEVAAQMRQIENGQFRVSFRSRGRVNVAQVAEKFGGGGHRNAAGCTIDGAADEVVSTVTDELMPLLGPSDDS